MAHRLDTNRSAGGAGTGSGRAVFTADRPNRLWVADATRIPCGQGTFWLAAVRDAFSNRIVGWKTSDRCDTELVLGALEFAVWSRDIRDGELIHHSDRGLDLHSDPVR
ncbi:DDE-type integrase/transposase/recombinase [Nocardia sp. NBC_01329]|uniref:DDE-type integrase/transposase/recombinase n=1 Tax=Nocardia sp. NBC_01329 TaxID=2903594 RepID=UPI002E1110FF|nr:DDE-type integrase/transposase/recombinase [Nocardia sp. NBC_01329]